MINLYALENFAVNVFFYYYFFLLVYYWKLLFTNLYIIFVFKTDGSKLSTVKKDDEIIINWSDCFINAGSLVYEVSVGTTQGGADVIQWQETKNTFINILLTEKLKSKSNLNLFFLVRAIDHNGAYSSISDDISV